MAKHDCDPVRAAKWEAREREYRRLVELTQIDVVRDLLVGHAELARRMKEFWLECKACRLNHV